MHIEKLCAGRRGVYQYRRCRGGGDEEQ